MRNWLWAMGALAALAATNAEAQRVDGFGSNVPLSFAVRQIVPNDYVVRFEPSVDQSAKVTWSGSDDWQTVLGGLARSKGLNYRVQGQNVIVGTGAAAPAAPVQAYTPPVQSYAAPASSGGMRTGGLVVLPTRSAAPEPAPYVAPAPAPAQSAPTSSSLPPVVGSGIGTSPAAAPAPAPEEPRPPVTPPPAPVLAPQADVPPPPARDESRMSRRERDRLRAAERAEARAAERAARAGAPAVTASSAPAAAPRALQQSGAWRAPRGETLNNVLGDWAERAGWTVVFTTRIVYELQAGAEFEGEFTEAAAALLRSVRADPMPHATFYRGNKVLVVADPSSN